MLVVAAAAALMPERGTASTSTVPLIGPVRILDGDTLDVTGTRIRLADIDAPELFSPQCDSELRLAQRARQRLADLVGTGTGITLSGTGVDRYGRDLRIVSRAGVSLGATLVAEGLARPWDGARHPWC
ncbi:MAG: thermonuclease family protein [Devosia sp.]